MRADSPESAPPIDLPLNDRAPVAEESSPLRGTVAAAEGGSSPSRGGRGVVVGVLVLGLLAGFGAGFVVGQRLAPPAPRLGIGDRGLGVGGRGLGTRDLGSGIGDRGSVVPGSPNSQSPIPDPQSPVPDRDVAPAPADPLPAAIVIEEPKPGAATPNPQPPVPSLAPAPRPATVRFDSRPPGATIYLDEVRVGVTPVTLNTVTPGTHQVRMEMLGSETWRTTVTVEAGAQHFVGASLE